MLHSNRSYTKEPIRLISFLMSPITWVLSGALFAAVVVKLYTESAYNTAKEVKQGTCFALNLGHKKEVTIHQGSIILANGMTVGLNDQKVTFNEEFLEIRNEDIITIPYSGILLFKYNKIVRQTP